MSARDILLPIIYGQMPLWIANADAVGLTSFILYFGVCKQQGLCRVYIFAQSMFGKFILRDTVLPAKSDSDGMFCLQLFGKT